MHQEQECSNFPAQRRCQYSKLMEWFSNNALSESARRSCPSLPESPAASPFIFPHILSLASRQPLFQPDCYRYGNGYIRGQKPMCISLSLFLLRDCRISTVRGLKSLWLASMSVYVYRNVFLPYRCGQVSVFLFKSQTHGKATAPNEKGRSYITLYLCHTLDWHNGSQVRTC